MQFKNIEVFNFNNAFRGMRNPLNSWDKSDSYYGIISLDQDHMIEQVVQTYPIDNDKDQNFKVYNDYLHWLNKNGILYQEENSTNALVFYLGYNDLFLARRLIKAGSSDRKFLRQIFVSIDITAPLYFWKEFDTYKIGTVANSTSTMHKLASTPITKDCFEMGDFNSDMMLYENDPYNPDIYLSEFWEMLINDLEHLRKEYNETKNQKYWKELVRLLPSGWLQTRTVTLNYEILRNIYKQRKHHRLIEWHQFCDWVKTLPYAYELILYNLD